MTDLRRLMRPIARRLSNMLARAVITGIESGGGLQRLQVALLGDELKAGVEHLEPYGFTAAPHEGAEGLAVFLAGDRSHGVVIVAGDRRYRLTGLKQGEVALYTDEGDKLVLKRGRITELDTGTFVVKASAKVRFETPVVETTGDVLDNAGANTRTVASMRAVFNGHAHPPSTAVPGVSM